MFFVKILFVIWLNFLTNKCFLNAFEFPKNDNTLSPEQQNIVNNLSTDELNKFIQSGLFSVNEHKRLEQNLISSHIIVINGSISHAQLLDALPNPEAIADSEVALKILKSSQYIYNSKCIPNNIDGESCEKMLSHKELPHNNELKFSCKHILESRRDGHHSFRRLLQRNYKDGLNAMWPNEQLPSPRQISSELHNRLNSQQFDENNKSLSIVQWTQFIEHDLSKPVVTTMSNGQPIECCNRDNYKLQPRYHHPACAPLFSKKESDKYGREFCLNYVRSALALGSKCTFAAPEQLNQATGGLDLSQLYGFTTSAQNRMRTWKDGQIKSAYSKKIKEQLLPLAHNNAHKFCAIKLGANHNNCFIAGDSRVNSNPFSIAIYTVFMRNHNRIASNLKQRHSNWIDEQIFDMAKIINTNIYRRIIFNEWLPVVVGEELARSINKKKISNIKMNESRISNEFGVSAIRFYLSMMPNTLHDFSSDDSNENKESKNNDIIPDDFIFNLEDEIYKSKMRYTADKLNDILESLLNQRAMKMDTNYVDSLTENDLGALPTHTDVLAYDIQRGRDHGLQNYAKYLQICANTKINSWKDLETFISKENINKLKSVYEDLEDIDLIVGGLSEKPINDSTSGVTFTCIIAEQFAKIRQWQKSFASIVDESHELIRYKDVTAAELLCDNSDLKYVAKNIFKLGSDRNPFIKCADRSLVSSK